MAELHPYLRLLLLYGHLLLCVFALQGVISGDWQVLQGRLHARQLERAHVTLSWLLGGLWFSGLLLVGCDTHFELEAVLARPKMVAKLVCVALLTLNGALLRAWCFPRLTRLRPLGRGEAMAVMACGAVSTASWLMAAFLGIARPLQSWTPAQCVALYGAALLLAVLVALLLSDRLRQRLSLAAGPAGLQHMGEPGAAITGT